MPPRLTPRALGVSLPLPLGASPVASTSAIPLPQRQPAGPGARQRSIHSSAGRRPRLALDGGNGSVRSFHASSRNQASAKDPYDVLGVKKDAKASEIKKTYYQLAKKWHPDSNKDKGANERFLEIQNAYDILSDDKKRKAYDTYGSASTQEGFDPDGFGRGGAGGFGGFQGFGGFGGGAGNAGDLFESLFGGAFGRGAGGGGAGGNPFGGGGGGGRARNVKGDDLEATVTLSFLEAAQGASRKINITPVVDCKPCTGSGLKTGESKQTCSSCRGTGQQALQFQGMVMASTCQACGGAGSTIPRHARCGECDGVGRVKERRSVDVDIPEGVEDGMKVKIPNAGDQPLSAQGPPGDLYVRVNVKPSAIFRRQGTNLYHDAKVPLHTALLGGRVRIPTLEGDVDVRVREGTQNGEEAVLKGRGVKSVFGHRGGDRGDLVVGWKIQIPRSLTTRQKKILQAFADDFEGREPDIHFGPPPPPPTPGSSSTASGSASANEGPTKTKTPVDDQDQAPTSASASATEPESNCAQEPEQPEASDQQEQQQEEEEKKAATG